MTMIPPPPSPCTSTVLMYMYGAAILLCAHIIVAITAFIIFDIRIPTILYYIIDLLSRAMQRLKINMNLHLHRLTSTPGSIKYLLLKLLQIVTVLIQFWSYRSTKRRFFLFTIYTMILSMGYSSYRDMLIRRNKYLQVRLSGAGNVDGDVVETVEFEENAVWIFATDFVLGCMTQWIQCLLLGYHFAAIESHSQMCLHVLFLWLLAETIKEDDDRLTATTNGIRSTITGALEWLEDVDDSSVDIVTLLRRGVNARVSISDVCHLIVTSELGIFVMYMCLLYVVYVVTGIRTFLLLSTLIFSLRTTLTHYQRHELFLNQMFLDAKSMLLSWASQNQLLRLLCGIAIWVRDFILCDNIDHLSNYDGFPPNSTTPTSRTGEEDNNDDAEEEEDEDEDEDDYDDKDDEDHADDDEDSMSMSSSSIDRQLEEALSRDVEEEEEVRTQASPEPATDTEQSSVHEEDIAPEQTTTVKGLSTFAKDEVATEGHDAPNVEEDDWLLI